MSHFGAVCLLPILTPPFPSHKSNQVIFNNFLPLYHPVVILIVR